MESSAKRKMDPDNPDEGPSSKVPRYVSGLVFPFFFNKVISLMLYTYFLYVTHVLMTLFIMCLGPRHP